MATLLRSRSLIRRIRGEDDGRLAGLQREHWDDHVDAKAFARSFVAAAEGSILLAPPIALVCGSGRILPVVAGGAFASGIYGGTLLDVFDASQLVIDLSLTTHKWAMYTNTLTPDFNVAAPAYSVTNEVSGAGYTAGGQIIVSPTTAIAATVLTYDMADQVWASPTTVTARGAILYADAITTPTADPLIVASSFGGADVTSTAGTFTIAWNAAGVFTIDYA